ncbi:MAG: restriction modification system DNA specificity domain-containing protein [Saprospiraceae bacterium]|nr:MAG: restriction modification system DNA specificity domain-containing protein [Saprospiraceae bacterium]
MMRKFKKYNDYQESNIGWIGEIPSSWSLLRLGSVFNERRLKVSDKEFPPLSVTKNGIVAQLETAAKSNDGDNRKGVLKGDFVINSRSDRKGSSGLAKNDGSVSLINIVIKPIKIVPQFSKYLLKSYSFIEEFYRNGHGIVADLWTTKYSEMKGMLIPLPSKEEQSAIANFLDQKTTQIDHYIQLKEKTIALLQERKAAIINQAVTKGLDPNVPMKDSGIEWLGEIPAHWEVKKLKYLSNLQSGLAIGPKNIEVNSKGIPYLRVANVQDGFLDLSLVKRIAVDKTTIKRYLLQKGDLLMNEGGDYDKLGRGYVWECEVDPCLHQNHVFAIRMYRNVDPYWINYVTLTSYAKEYFKSKAKRTTNLASISSRNIKEFPVIFPPRKVQMEIIRTLKQKEFMLDELVFKIQKEVSLIKEYRESLISAAVTGKIDVRDYAEKQQLSYANTSDH